MRTAVSPSLDNLDRTSHLYCAITLLGNGTSHIKVSEIRIYICSTLITSVTNDQGLRAAETQRSAQNNESNCLLEPNN
jgi:hypothetical protein